MRNYFPKRPSGAPLHTLSKLYDVPVGFVTPPPYFEEQDKSSDIEQQPPFGDRKISNIQPQNWGGEYKTNRNII